MPAALKPYDRAPHVDWIVEAQERGAGEIVLNCLDQDGAMDMTSQLRAARKRLISR